jgi:hypothetical protein
MNEVNQSDKWQDAELELEWDLKEFKKLDMKAADGYTKQPVLFLYTVSGKFQGQLEFYVQLIGSEQLKDKKVQQISYTMQ